MAVPFSSTLRSLEGDRNRRTRATACVAFVSLLVWSAWFAAARVDLHEVSESARIEAGEAAHATEAATGGRVVAVSAVLGADVALGDALVVLDSRALSAERDELRANHEAIGPQIEAAEREVGAQQRMLQELRRETRSVRREARARWREARAGSRFSTEEARRLRRMQALDLVSELDSLRAQAGAARQRAEVQALDIAVERGSDAQRVREQEHEIEIARLDRQIAELRGEQLSLAASLVRIERTIDEHTIRAPITGRVGAITALHEGSYVQAGDVIATIVPSGALRAVAEFPVSEANGRVHVGQSARMLFDGYPSVEFGQLEARVASVGTEPREGRVRVELHVASNRIGAIPLEHGMTGTVRIAVERASPLALVLRVLGRTLIAAPRQS